MECDLSLVLEEDNLVHLPRFYKQKTSTDFLFHLIKAWWISASFCFFPKFGSVKKQNIETKYKVCNV